ncbi:hypothetical protein, partial [Alienimonas chondri]|uniref:hypothetical protein n=1 Tax=Alienimonas chondri TaxID=2681879 RepID=UPI001488ED1C
MTLAPLLLAVLIAPPTDGVAEDTTGVALARQSAATLEAALEAPLTEAVAIEAGMPLPRALAELLPGQTVLPDLPRMELEGIDYSNLRVTQPLTFPAGRLTTRTAVQEALDQTIHDVPLVLLNDDGIARVTTRDYLAERLTTRLYRVRDVASALGTLALANVEWRSAREAGWQAGWRDGWQSGWEAGQSAAEGQRRRPTGG